jgi:hypothetical protein
MRKADAPMSQNKVMNGEENHRRGMPITKSPV